jgi:Nuclease-related domain
MLNHAIAHDPSARAPGQHAREIVIRLRLRTLVALGVLAVATALLGRAFGLRNIGFLASEVGLLAAMFVVLRYILPLVERHDRGAAGEEQVGKLLDGLVREEGWHVLHDASLGHGNVDHILLGPAGVFTVETKSHPGPVRVGRVHGSTLGQAQAQRRAIEVVTGLPVEPLIVYSRAWVDRPLARRRGVRVLPARMLAGYLERRRPALSATQVSRAHEQIVETLAQARQGAGGHGVWYRRSAHPSSRRA